MPTGIVGQNVIAPVVPFSTADVYPSHLAIYGQGGLRSVANVTERDAIPPLRREAGMLVWVASLSVYQQLGTDLATWTAIGVQGPTGPAGAAYTLPAATSTILGGVKVGSNLSVTIDGTLSSTASSGAWNDITGKPTTFAPSAHATSHGALGGDPITLAVSQVTGLQAALDGKQAVGSYAPLTHTHTASAITDFSSAVAAAIPASVVVTTDNRLTNSRSPTSHAASHAAGGTDAVTLTIAQTTGLQAAIDLKAPLASPTFTGTVSGVTKGMVGLGNVENTADASKPVSTAQAAADAAVQAYAIQRAMHTGTQAASTVTGLAAVATSGSYLDLGSRPTLGTAAQLDVPAAGNASSTQVVKGSDSRLSDSRTPSSTLSHASTHAAAGSDPVTLTIAQTTGLQTALDAKAPLASPAFTGTVTGITKSMVGLGSVDNVADDSKPVSTAQAAANTAVQAYAIQRANHTGTQASTTITGLGTLATQSGTFSGTSSGTNTGDQTITLTGDVTGSGTGSFSATLSDSGATAGTYTSVTVDTKGRVTSGTNPSGYSLPTATASVLGGIKIGSGLSIDASGVVSSSGSYTLPDATTLVKGGVIVGTGLGVSSGTLSANVTSVAGRTGAVTIASSDVSGLATVASSGLASDLTGTLADARLTGNIITANGLAAMVGSYDGTNYYVDTGPRFLANGNNTQGAGGINFVYFSPGRTVTVTGITFVSGSTAASGLTLCRFGLYTFDGTTATLVASTTSDTTIFAAANTPYRRLFSASASYTLQAGARYLVACLQVGTTPANLLSITCANFNGLGPRFATYVSGGLTDLPSSRNTSGDSGTTQMNFARLA